MLHGNMGAMNGAAYFSMAESYSGKMFVELTTGRQGFCLRRHCQVLRGPSELGGEQVSILFSFCFFFTDDPSY
jgi:hypothetical protein